jgi:hypothetical protein
VKEEGEERKTRLDVNGHQVPSNDRSLAKGLAGGERAGAVELLTRSRSGGGGFRRGLLAVLGLVELEQFL